MREANGFGTCQRREIMNSGEFSFEMGSWVSSWEHRNGKREPQEVSQLL